MEGKENRTSLSLNWAYRNEIIEGLIKLNLNQKTQEILGCQIMKDVFLEYPWAYVLREDLITVLRQDDEPQLIPFKKDIEKYEEESFLVGYASTELISYEYVICITENARNLIAERNKKIKKLLDRRVFDMFYKKPKPWISKGSELEVGEYITKSQRPLFEVEISMPSVLLGVDKKLTNRQSTDAKDGYMEIVPSHERFHLVPMSRLTTSVQTNLPGRETGIQTNYGFPKNSWTQYGYDYQTSKTPEDLLDHENLEEEPDIQSTDSIKPEETTTENILEVEEETPESQISDKVISFMEKYTKEMIDVIDYNAAMNLHVHDIDELVLKGKETRPTDEVNFEEITSFIDLSLTEGKVISDVSWHPTLTGVVVICYTEIPSCDLVQGPSMIKNSQSSIYTSGSVVLLWSLTNSMSPIFNLEHDRPVVTISFCPFKPDILIGGCETGNIIIWDFTGRLTKCSIENCCNEKLEGKLFNERVGRLDRNVVPVLSQSAVSKDFQSHHGTIHQIQWVPPYNRIEPDGRLITLPENTNLQFLTASEDGSVAVWDLSWEPRAVSSSTIEKGSSNISKILDDEFPIVTSKFKKIDGLFKPIYFIYLQVHKETKNLPLLSLFIQTPDISFQEIFSLHKSSRDIFEIEESKMKTKFFIQTYQLNFTRNNKTEYQKQFWAGSPDGDFVNCEWEGHEFTEVASSENCKYLGWSRVHDGPVTRISQSPHLPEILLTVGGRVFAVWKQDFLQSPLLLRKCGEFYTACCWTSCPGVFMVAKSNGDIETWDICTSTNEYLTVQSISGKRITGLFPHVLPLEKDNLIGISDHNGAFRIFKEPNLFTLNKLTRIQWLVEFIDREVKRKKEFTEWESNYLKNDPHCLQRKSVRAADEAKRRHEEARTKFQKEQEELARIDEERRAKQVKKSKTEKWRDADLDRMKSILLAKKGYNPQELEETRKPLIQQEKERSKKLKEAEKRVENSESYYKDAISIDLPKLPDKKSSHDVITKIVDLHSEENIIDQKIIQAKLHYERISDEACKKLKDHSKPVIFDPEKMISNGRSKRKEIDIECLKRSKKNDRLIKMAAKFSS